MTTITALHRFELLQRKALYKYVLLLTYEKTFCQQFLKFRTMEQNPLVTNNTL